MPSPSSKTITFLCVLYLQKDQHRRDTKKHWWRIKRDVELGLARKASGNEERCDGRGELAYSVAPKGRTLP